MFHIPNKKIMFKISGEALCSSTESHDFAKISIIADNIMKMIQENFKVCLVIGGGNIFRGRDAEKYGLNRVKADYIGMVATIINAMILHQFFATKEVKSKVFSSFAIDNNIVQKFDHDLSEENLNNNSVNIFCGGTGSPYFTTDSAAVLKAVEMGCDILFKATQVDGIYDSDPKINLNARRYDYITYNEVLEKKLNVMDMTAISLAQENKLPIVIFSIQDINNLYSILKGQVNHSQVKESP
jgi:uridylate kinase